MSETERNYSDSGNHEPTDAEKVLGSMPKNPIHDIYDDSYWEKRNPESISTEDYAKLVGIELGECREACEEAIKTGKIVKRKEGDYQLLGDNYMDGDAVETFSGCVWAFPNDSKARFQLEGTEVWEPIS